MVRKARMTKRDADMLRNSGTKWGSATKDRKLGTTYEMLVPILFTYDGKPEPLAYAVSRRSINPNAKLGVYGYVYRDGDFSEDEEARDLTGLQDWARVTNILFKAQELKELKDYENSIADQIEKLGSVDPTTVQEGKKKIIAKYEETKAPDGSTIYPTESPLIGSNRATDFYFALRVEVDELMKVKDWGSAVQGVIDANSKKKRDAINDMASSALYWDFNHRYVEFTHAYKGTTESEAQRAAGYVKVKIKESIPETHKDEWEAKLAEKFNTFFGDIPQPVYSWMEDGTYKNLDENQRQTFSPAYTDEDIDKYYDYCDKIAEYLQTKNSFDVNRHTLQEITSAIRQYVSQHVQLYPYISMEDNTTKAIAKFVSENKVFSAASKIQDQFDQMAAETVAPAQETEEAPTQAPTVEDLQMQAEANAARDLVKASGASAIDDVLNGLTGSTGIANADSLL